MFLAHKNDIETGHWQVLEQAENTQTLLNDDGVFKLQSNLCTHQGSRIRSGQGRGLASVCPYHGYSWSKDGAPVGSGTVGHAESTIKCKNKDPLQTQQVYEWSGFLFSEPVPVDFNVNGNYKLVEYRQDVVKSNPTPIMDLFLDIDHIPMVHPGLYDKIDVPDVRKIKWSTWNGGSIQYVPGAPAEDSQWTQYTKNRNLTCSAAWLAQYDGTMFEWQPGAVFVMVNRRIDDATTRCHVFKYQDLDYPNEAWEINSGVWETAWQQDCDQSQRLEPGWRTIKPENLEPQKQEFRAWTATKP